MGMNFQDVLRDVHDPDNHQLKVTTVNDPATASLQTTANSLLLDLDNRLMTLNGIVLGEDTTHISGDAGVGALVVQKATPVDLASDGEYANMQVSKGGTWGITVPDCGRTLLSKCGTVSSSGDNALVSAGTNRLKVYAFSLSTVSSTAVTCIFRDGSPGGTGIWQVILQTPSGVAGGANLVVQPPGWLFATSAASPLAINLSAAVTVHYSISYFDEA